MDLSLRGSQINLVTRYKTKAPTVKYPPLNQRPGSAISYRRPRSSQQQYYYRPQSADEQLARSLDNCIRFSEGILNEGKLNRNKKYSSISSSNILKLLLEDRIKRPWLCRDSSDNQSECSLVSKRKQQPNSSSIDESSMDEEYNYRKYSEDHESKPYSKSIYSSIPAIKITPTPTPTSTTTIVHNTNNMQSQNRLSESQFSQKLTICPVTKTKTNNNPSDYWHETKPDLPGRVSFGKIDSYELDISDCENESTSNIVTNESSIINNPLTTANKKSVHFGRNSEEVQSQTYEYPKCPSDNCSCSTRSSVSATCRNGQDSNESYEYYQSPCKSGSTTEYSKLQIDSKNSGNNFEKNYDENTIINDYKNAIKCDSLPSAIKSDIFVVDDYKKTIDDDDHKFQLDLKLNDSNESTSSSYQQNNNIFVNNFEREKLNANNEIKSDKYDSTNYQNNFSNPSLQKNHTISLYQDSKRNSILSNNIESQQQNQHNFVNHENGSVINNYLNAASEPILPQKTLNNNYSEIKSSRNSIKTSKLLKNHRRSKSAITSSSSSSTIKDNSKINRCGRSIKKSDTYSSLRDDSHINEFNIDKIDSWMSLHDHEYSDNLHHQQQHNPKQKQQQHQHQHQHQHQCLQNFQRFPKQNEEIDHNAETPETETSENSKSDDNSQDDSTYDEIVSVIKEIENEKINEELSNRAQKEIEFKLQTIVGTDSSQTSITGKDTPETDSPDKLKDILSYLEDVEHSCDRTLMETRRSMPDTNRTEVDFSVEPDIAEDVPKLADLLMLPNHQLARRIISLSLRANELSNAIHLSKQHIGQIKLDKQKSIRLEKQNSANRNRDQKKQFEKIVVRHQSFIEQLLKDKGSLCEKITALTRRMESQNQAWEHKLDTEISRIKETTLAGEKIRRERWVRENTKKIKELTVKGLEVEINKMNCNHQQEITNLKRNHQQEILDAVDETRLKYEQIENSIRESCAQDRETLIQKERNAIRERFEKQLHEERKSSDEQKNKLIEDFASERERLQLEIREKDNKYVEQKQNLQNDNQNMVTKVTLELQQKMEQQEEKYQTRIKAIEKQFDSDFLIWKREFENCCKMRDVEKENAIRQNYRCERDRQIDAIVSRMDLETQKAQEEFEMKISRLKEKHEKDTFEMESSEKAIREKYNDTRSRLAESEAQVQNQQAEIKQLQIELEHSKKMCNEFLVEKEKLKENSRNDVKIEVATIKAERDNEIQKIYKRVQQAIEKKDATIELLQKENGTIRERCIKLEAVIRQQRKDYCIK